ncbi:MAG: serine/threonine protein kinase [Pirellulales bacterium]|nr:serine/threonine protein kinase [Pirellulales bacterium]
MSDLNEHEPSPPGEPQTQCRDMSGRRLGGYQLLRRLGQGAMAEVYLAEQSSLKRLVAIKILKPDLAHDETYRKRLQREAEAAASLIHANIVQIHEVGCFEDVDFIAQEYVEGQNLRQWIAGNPKPDLPHALSIIRQVAAALNKAAEHNIVHRDIKPENILVTNSGEVKVADFGLARLPRHYDGVDLTQVGITLGTPLYMSPEQVEGKTLDPRSDIYSFGVTCYQMFAGRPPFGGQTSLSVAVQHLKKDPPPLQEFRDDLPSELCRIVHRMLAKNPKDRYQSSRQLLKDLRKLQTEELGDSWPENLPGWTASGLESMPHEPVRATQRIQALMDTAEMPASRDYKRAALPVALLLATSVGALIAWPFTTQEPLIDKSQIARDAGPPVEREKTVLLQWIAATKSDTENAWLALIKYYPQKKNYVRRAYQQLARLYLREGDDVRALEICHYLATFDPDDKELQVFGLAGECIALARLKRTDEFKALYKSLKPNLGSLKDEQLSNELSAITKRSKRERKS